MTHSEMIQDLDLLDKRMRDSTNWLLPEGVEEILPQAAEKLEQLRRDILDDLQARGFQLVMPPVMEFVDSLLTGTGEELDTQTYKFMDQHTHRMLGVRADMTPQIARIDAHYLTANEVNRLCYAGTVLKTQPDQMGGQRELLQIGAELFGVEGLSADIEIIESMLSALNLSGARQLTLSVGHVGIYRALLQTLEVPDSLRSRVFDILLRKSAPDLDELHGKFDCKAFAQLLKLQGGVSVLDTAMRELPQGTEIETSLQEIRIFVETIQHNHPAVNVHIDLADVLGYRYHTGLKFHAYVAGQGRAIAKGGRYPMG